ncbi:MAG: transposase, partial [Candidatus Binatia bacterium]
MVLGIDKLVSALGVVKEKGFSVLQTVLALVFLAVIGKKRLSKAENLKDHGIAALAGFSSLPSKSYFFDFLDRVTQAGAESFEIAGARVFKKLGVYGGKIANLDSHLIGYFGNLKIGKDRHPTRNKIMRGIKAFFTQDQETGNPVFARVEYPRKGLKPEDVAISMLKTTREILPELEKAVFDKWFSVGSLLEYLDKSMKLKFVTLLKLFENRIEEMENISPKKFRELVGEDAMIAFKDTDLRGYSGNVKLIVVKKEEEDGEEKYYGYLTNDYESGEEQIVKEKGWRWRIENFFKDCDFLGLGKLPSIELNKIAVMVAMKFFSFNLLACLRKDLGGDYGKMTPESVFEEIIEFPAIVKAKEDRLVVTFYGNYKPRHKEAVEKLMQKLDEKEMN